jgi:hypothetical protein
VFTMVCLLHSSFDCDSLSGTIVYSNISFYSSSITGIGIENDNETGFLKHAFP